ncbi:MAG: hypothetical protein ABII74_10070, partial [Elusimicrobiota bacterium]
MSVIRQKLASDDCCFYIFIPKGFWNIGGDEIPAKIVKNNLSPEGAKVFSVFSILFSCALS